MAVSKSYFNSPFVITISKDINMKILFFIFTYRLCILLNLNPKSLRIYLIMRVSYLREAGFVRV